MTINRQYKQRRKLLKRHVLFALFISVVLIIIPWFYKQSVPTGVAYKAFVYNFLPNFGLGFLFPFLITNVYLLFNKPTSLNYFSKRNFLPFALFSIVFVVVFEFWQHNLSGHPFDINDIKAGVLGAIASFIYFAIILYLVGKELNS